MAHHASLSKYMMYIGIVGLLLSAFTTIMSWFYWVPGNRVELVANVSILTVFALIAIAPVIDQRKKLKIRN